MTKEEIYQDATFHDLAANPTGTRMDIVYAAMDLYAKQQCILYEQWILKRIFPMMANGQTNQQASEELYQTFLTETSI